MNTRNIYNTTKRLETLSDLVSHQINPDATCTGRVHSDPLFSTKFLNLIARDTMNTAGNMALSFRTCPASLEPLNEEQAGCLLKFNVRAVRLSVRQTLPAQISEAQISCS